MVAKSGISNKSILPYPKIYPLDKNSGSLMGGSTTLSKKLVYAIEPYNEDGLSVLIFAEGDKIGCKFGTWNGEEINIMKKHSLSKYIDDLYKNNLERLMGLLKLIGVEMMQLYFSISKEIKLVDVRTYINKFLSPGMIRDVFSKFVNVQNIVETGMFEDIIGKHKNIVIKPSKPFMYEKDDDLIPAYFKLC